MDHLAEIRRFWDEDAPTYDDAPGHRPREPAVLAAWSATLGALLPPAPARVLDCGAGTGFLSLLAAEAGHVVTALDLAPRMLEHLVAEARRRGLSVQTVSGPAHEPPAGPFDVVIERHLVWTLPEPATALAAWREVAERLVLVESLWGDADPVERVRGRARARLRRLRGTPPDHHGEYPGALRAALPFGRGTPPEAVVEAVAEAGWSRSRLIRLRDVEWAERRTLGLPERLVGVTPRFAVSAERA